jgi:predicted RNase H-like nuclease (RuvC/YqgF family)
MRKPVLTLLIVAAVALAGTTAYLYSRFTQTSAELATVKVAEEASRNRYAQTIDAIAEIQDSLNAIMVGDANVSLVQGGLQSEKGMSAPDGRDALDRIANLRASIERSKSRIRQLESSLKTTNVEAKGLKRMVASLKSSVAEKETALAALTQRVEELSTQVTGLETTVQQSQEQIAQKDQTIEERRSELATVYYVVGSKGELTKSGVVVSKGGVLGMGKTLQPTGQIAADLMKPLDTDEQTVITINAPKAQVVSDQPVTSYELRLVGTQTELHILNPVEFRKVRQLVIVTA